MSEKKQSEDLLRTLEELGEVVDPVIEEILRLSVDKKFSEIVKYQLSAGGKRLRPALLLSACYLLNGKTKYAIYPAAGIEILHNYTLIIDDIIDNSYLRRGKPTLWKKLGKSTAECVAMIYASSIFQATQRSKNPILISEMFARGLKLVTEGEILDILYDRKEKENEPYIQENRFKEISLKDYLEMIMKKTAILFQLSCEIGGISANGSKEEVNALGGYGLNLGMAFQIQDDILDIFGDEKKLGKQIGKDIVEGKGGNIVILLAIEKLKNKDKKELLDILSNKKILKRDIKRAIELIEKTNSKEMAEKMGEEYIKESKSFLEPLPKNEWYELMNLLANFVIKRYK